MVNIFNREFVIHITHMKAETKATCVPVYPFSIQVSLACCFGDKAFSIKGFEVTYADPKLLQ